MSISRPIDSIAESDLVALIDGAIPESTTLDFKRVTYGKADADKREFLADISAFANTLGGDLIIGLDEAGGVATAIVPFTGNADNESRRLEDMARTGLEPRLTSLRIRAVPVSGGAVFVIRVPRSFSAPHRVIAQNSNRFFARGGTQKYEPNVDQLRHLFLDTPVILDRIRAFHADRLVKITAGETPASLTRIGKLVLHVVPVPSFIDGRMADLVTRVAGGTHSPVPLDIVNFGTNWKVNLDGYLSHAVMSPGQTGGAYAQFFRNGAIEGVGALRSDDSVRSRFITRDLTNVVVSRTRQYLDVLKAYDLGTPVYVFLAICNATDVVYRYVDGSGMGWNETLPLGREIIALPETYIDDLAVDVIDVMKPALTALWNAFGFIGCERYNDVAKWKAGNPYSLFW
ncbi:MAG: ATP-binding protein [Opitutaceae bacterium]|nr:ATP-binding protein [Opitutaceae bacterium]